jgi:hypothetical protein
LAAEHPDHRQRPVAQYRNNAVGDGVQVVDGIPLDRPGPLEQRLVQVGQRDAVPDLIAAHRINPGCRGREVNSGQAHGTGRLARGRRQPDESDEAGIIPG